MDTDTIIAAMSSATPAATSARAWAGLRCAPAWPGSAQFEQQTQPAQHAQAACRVGEFFGKRQPALPAGAVHALQGLAVGGAELAGGIG